MFVSLCALLLLAHLSSGLGLPPDKANNGDKHQHRSADTKYVNSIDELDETLRILSSVGGFEEDESHGARVHMHRSPKFWAYSDLYNGDFMSYDDYGDEHEIADFDENDWLDDEDEDLRLQLDDEKYEDLEDPSVQSPDHIADGADDDNSFSSRINSVEERRQSRQFSNDDAEAIELNNVEFDDDPDRPESSQERAAREREEDQLLAQRRRDPRVFRAEVFDFGLDSDEADESANLLRQEEDQVVFEPRNSIEFDIGREQVSPDRVIEAGTGLESTPTTDDGESMFTDILNRFANIFTFY